MKNHLLKFELLSIIRDWWIAVLALLVPGLIFFAIYNGNEHSEKIRQDLHTVLEEQAETETYLAAQMDSISRGLLELPSWQDPTLPRTYGWYYPKVAEKKPGAFSFASIGQSDLYAHYVRPGLSDASLTLSFSELSNPVQLMFGKFDLAFVCIYLLPLLVLAFSYNLISEQREQGSLRLILAQPVSFLKWLLYKTGIRFLMIWSICVASMIAGMLLFGLPLATNTGPLLLITLVLGGYLFFWFIISLLVNLRGRSSGHNVVTLLSIWVILVVLLPSTLNQTVNQLYPVPSRAQMIADMREARQGAEQQADVIMANYLRDHPELGNPDDESASGYWPNYFAAQDLILEKIGLVLSEHQRQVENRQRWVGQLRFLSPAIIMQSIFNDLAETSARHYRNFENQAKRYTESWRAYFIPRIFTNERITPAEMSGIPAFEYEPLADKKYPADLLILLLYLAGTGWAGIVFFRRTSTENLLSNEK